jgi:Mg2+/Co2+ transporter CorC
MKLKHRNNPTTKELLTRLNTNDVVNHHNPLTIVKRSGNKLAWTLQYDATKMIEEIMKNTGIVVHDLLFTRPFYSTQRQNRNR